MNKKYRGFKIFRLIPDILSSYLFKILAKYLLWEAPLFFLYFLAVSYVYVIFKEPANKSLQSLNYAFVFIAALSGLCFAWSSCLKDDNKGKDQITYAGERFFHSSILLLLASLTKYLGLKYSVDFVLIKLIQLFYKIIIYYSLFMALLYFYAGLHTVSKFLWKNRNRYKDWDKASDDEFE
jgi:hypothetical protein